MGIAISFEGRLVDPAAYDCLVEVVSSFAAERGWPATELPRDERELGRVIDEVDVDYIGPSFGIEVLPSPDCEPLRFEFDETLFIQEFCKTQFAGPSVHMQIVELLREVEPLFVNLLVEDEGHFWETGDRESLQRHLQGVQGILDDMLARDPGATGPVRLASGRIVDLRTIENPPDEPPRRSFWARLWKRN